MNELLEPVLNKLNIFNYDDYGFLGLPGSIDGGNFSIIVINNLLLIFLHNPSDR